MIYIVLILVFLLLLWILYAQFARRSGLRVLMYHKVSEHQKDGLTVSVEQLREHLEYLVHEGYNFISFKDLMNTANPIPEKPMILTFDDGYVNNFTMMYPLLKALQLKATVFLPVKYLGLTNVWDQGDDKIMSAETIKTIDSACIEWGLHSFEHKNYKTMSPEEIDRDIKMAVTELRKQEIEYLPVLAYPYGGFPRKGDQNRAFKEVLKKNNIKYGLRIGNRINSMPLKDIYEINRIDIKGSDSFDQFKNKVKRGKIKLF